MSTDDEKAAARKAERERRQARIKASGANRLAKITGSAGAQDFKGPPPASAAATQQSPSLTPTLSAASSASRTPPTEPASASPGSPAVSRPMRDPLMELLAQSNADPDDPFVQFLSAQAQNLQAQQGQQGKAAGQVPVDAQSYAQTQQRVRQRSRFDLAWDIVHFIVSMLVGAYTARINPWSLTTLFVAVEAALVGTQVVLGHHNSEIAGVSMLAPFLTMLPRNRQRQISFAGSVFNVARTAYRDFATVLFAYGALSLGGAEFARPAS